MTLRRAVLVMFVLLVAPPPAMAASHASVENGVLTVVASPGEENWIGLSYMPQVPGGPPPAFSVGDSRAGETAGPGCTTNAGCEAEGVTEIRILAGDGADRVTLTETSGSPVPIHVFGGDGDDRLEATQNASSTNLHGEAGDDRLGGGESDDVVTGGPGNDDLTGGEGRNRVEGGDGDDVIHSAGEEGDQMSCGAGQDRVFRKLTDTWTPDCEVLDGLYILALGCAGRTACIPNEDWRIGVQIGSRPSTRPVGALRAATGTMYLRTLDRVTPPGGGPRRHVRLGPAVRFSVRKGKIAVARYPLNADARRLVLRRPKIPVRTIAVISTRNENGFLQEEPDSGFGICLRSRCG